VRCGRRVNELVLDVLELLSRALVVVELVEASDDVRSAWLGDRAAREDLLLATPDTIGPALQRAIDRLRARGEPPLQDGESEPTVLRRLPSSLAARFIPWRRRS
jgi:IS4 transposase